MAAPVADKIQLPLDTGNTGKKVRTVTRTVGADSVHEHFYIPNKSLTVTGRYHFGSSLQSVQSVAQNATATGFYWFQLPTGATVSAILRRIHLTFSKAGLNVVPTAPRLNFSKFTFTGVASGATEAALPSVTGGAASQMVVRTAVTGMTVALVAPVCVAMIPACLSAAGLYGGVAEPLGHDPTGFTRVVGQELAPGEGLVVYQPDAGSGIVSPDVADDRKFTINMVWDEVDLS